LEALLNLSFLETMRYVREQEQTVKKTKVGVESRRSHHYFRKRCSEFTENQRRWRNAAVARDAKFRAQTQKSR
jgi:hypothetical protein